MKKIYLVAVIAIFAIIVMPANIFAAGPTWTEFKDAMTSATATYSLSGDLVGQAEAVTVAGEVTLDLGGNTLTLNEQIIVEGKLTIGGNGKIFTDKVDGLFIVRPGSTLVVNDVVIENTAHYAGAIQIFGETGKNTQVDINEGADITACYPAYISKPGGQNIIINVYGKMTAISTESAGQTKSGAALYVNGNITDMSANAPVINIYSGANLIGRDDDCVGIYAAGYAVWNIFGGYFEGDEALTIKSGEFNITGGSFHADGKYVSPVLPDYNASEKSGSAISITSNKGYPKKIVMNIKNAEVFSENGYAILEVSTDVADGEDTYLESIKIENGVFHGGKEAIFAENVNNFVKGGIYNTDVEKYVDTTLDSIKDEETGEYFVGTLNKVNVKETENGKVEVSLTEAVKDQFVEIKATANDGYKVGTVVVKDASGSEIKVTNDIFVMPDSEVTVEVTFEKEVLIEDEKDEDELNDDLNEEKTEEDSEKLQVSGKGEADSEVTQKDGLDETPKTGALDIILYVAATVAIVTVISIKVKKQAMKKLV